MDDNKVRALFDGYHEDPTKAICIVADVNQKLVGCLYGIATEFYFSDFLVCTELIWWVDEDYRNTSTGIKLFKAFEFWAKRIGAQYLSAVNTEGTTDLSKLYNHSGYHLAESTYVKALI